MKNTCVCLAALLFLWACKPETDNAARVAFENNSETVKPNLEGWARETLDYTMYASDFVMLETAFGAEKDSLNLDEMKAADRQMWDTYDFKMLTTPPALLPGVNPDTREPDGSVRHYSSWQVTLPATDSTEARSGIIHLYESFDFNAEGKITLQQVYGDFTGLMAYLHGSD